MTQAANFLNMLLQAQRHPGVQCGGGCGGNGYQALVRSVAEDPRAYRLCFDFNPRGQPPAAGPAGHPGLGDHPSGLVGEQGAGRRAQLEPCPTDLQSGVLTNDLRSLGGPKWPQGDGYVEDVQHVRLSPPFLECQESRRPGWLITLSTTFWTQPDLWRSGKQV